MKDEGKRRRNLPRAEAFGERKGNTKKIAPILRRRPSGCATALTLPKPNVVVFQLLRGVPRC